MQMKPAAELVFIACSRSSRRLGAKWLSRTSHPRSRAASPTPASNPNRNGSERRLSLPCGRGTIIAIVASAVPGPTDMLRFSGYPCSRASFQMICFVCSLIPGCPLRARDAVATETPAIFARSERRVLGRFISLSRPYATLKQLHPPWPLRACPIIASVLVHRGQHRA